MGCMRCFAGFGLTISSWVFILFTVFLVIKIDFAVDWNWAFVRASSFIPFGFP